mgnify:CR=1 FL=1
MGVGCQSRKHDVHVTRVCALRSLPRSYGWALGAKWCSPPLRSTLRFEELRR